MTSHGTCDDTSTDGELFSSERYARMCQLFAEASELERDARTAFLDAACADDQALRSHLEQSLAELDEPSPFLATEPRELPSGNERISRSPQVPEQLGSYRILRPLGSGNMADVYVAEQKSPRRQVALKVLAISEAPPNLRKRFAREAELLGKLSHPGLVEIFESGVIQEESHEFAFIAMELVDGRTLAQALSTLRQSKAPGLIDQAIQWVMQAARAIDAAHQAGVLHRDIKPENILIGRDNNPVVIDFGVGRGLSDEWATLTDTQHIAPGTLLYMSPEQVDVQAVDLDERTDVWSLGVLLYESVTGERPFSSASFGDRSQSVASLINGITNVDPCARLRKNPTVSRDLIAVLERALEKRRERRYPSAAALAQDLQRVLEHRPTEARPSTTTERLVRKAKLHPWTAGLAITVLLATALTFLWGRFSQQTAVDSVTATGQAMFRVAHARYAGVQPNTDDWALICRFVPDAQTRERLYDLPVDDIAFLATWEQVSSEVQRQSRSAGEAATPVARLLEPRGATTQARPIFAVDDPAAAQRGWAWTPTLRSPDGRLALQLTQADSDASPLPRQQHYELSSGETLRPGTPYRVSLVSGDGAGQPSTMGHTLQLTHVAPSDRDARLAELQAIDHEPSRRLARAAALIGLHLADEALHELDTMVQPLVPELRPQAAWLRAVAHALRGDDGRREELAEEYFSQVREHAAGQVSP
ncbi:MAG: serine/threonine protein kinase [Pseudohongiellaceae bacterium]|jgi:serine/threonine protein kinase